MLFQKGKKNIINTYLEDSQCKCWTS